MTSRRRRLEGVDLAARAGRLVLLAVAVVGVAAPWLVDATHVDLGLDLAPPGPGRPLCSAALGVDVVAGLVWGARGAVGIGAAVAVIATLTSTLIAISLSRAPTALRRVLSRSVDVWLAFPSLLLAAALQALMSPSLLSVVVVLIITSWAGPARLLLAMADVAWASPHVDAARALGASSLRLALRHVAPQLGPTIAV